MDGQRCTGIIAQRAYIWIEFVLMYKCLKLIILNISSPRTLVGLLPKEHISGLNLYKCLKLIIFYRKNVSLLN